MFALSRSRRLLPVVFFALLFLAGCGDGRLEADRAKAESQVNRCADTLDGQTTEAGVYIRPEKPELPEKDPWGASLVVHYSQGGTTETLVVRSFGPDEISHTEDDITTQRVAVNLKGIGQGIKENADETAEETTKGAVRGAIEGAKEGIRNALKKDNDHKETPNPSPEPSAPNP
ncbi:MAG TPA: hypothetical protein DD670_16205 [Planctomycetaceae bacterium]|nr:hypothetical protein [Planctomycetaceae bacterium]